MAPLLIIAALLLACVVGACFGYRLARAGALRDRLIADDLHDVPMGLPEDEDEETRQ